MSLKKPLIVGVLLASTFAASSALAAVFQLGVLPTPNAALNPPYTTNPNPAGAVFAPNTFTFTEGSPAYPIYDFSLSSFIKIPRGNILDYSSGQLEIFSGAPGSGTLLYSAFYEKSAQKNWVAEIVSVPLAPGDYYFLSTQNGGAGAKDLNFAYILANQSAVPEAST
ncbi:hypothetical protein [uncultured Rhodoblastus sp.]|uniref:hypothetical protein n=1 Tax=uncultured Rhodoblastus sp. TaxID=543037 RepID=UPI0025CFE2F0|nr:hypothetical protein [uncultured Rhodoblastus sp.]